MCNLWIESLVNRVTSPIIDWSFMTHGSSVRRLPWRTQHALPASCSSRLLSLRQPRFHHIQLLNEVTVGRGCSVGHQCKLAGVILKCVPGGVCFSFNRTCAFLQLWRRYPMNKVICFTDRRSTHRYHLFIWIIMNICNQAEKALVIMPVFR